MTIDRGGSTSELNKTPCPCGSRETPGEACWTSLQLNHSTPGGRTARGARVRFVSRFPTTPYTRNTTLCTHTTRRPLLTASRHLRPTALTLSMLRHSPPSAAAAVFSFVAWPGDRVSTRRWGQTVLSPVRSSGALAGVSLLSLIAARLFG